MEVLTSCLEAVRENMVRLRFIQKLSESQVIPSLALDMAVLPKDSSNVKVFLNP